MTALRPPVRLIDAQMQANDLISERAVGAAVRGLLTLTVQETTAALYTGGTALVAATPRGAVSLGELLGWWSTEVTEKILPAIERIWRKGFTSRTDGKITRTSADALTVFTAGVRDRLVEGLTPPLPDAAFDAVRVSITTGAAQGWTTKQTAQHIAASLAWETDGPYWRQQLSTVDAAIDRILDPLGPPGNPVREAARVGDARVQALRNLRNEAVKHLDAEGTYWQNRATLIARTESTGAYNYGALTAFDQEGVKCKRWLATSDSRTRPTHRVADGQVVRLRSAFTVGGYSMQMPGSPSAPPDEVCNCRCSMVQADCSDLS